MSLPFTFVVETVLTDPPSRPLYSEVHPLSDVVDLVRPGVIPTFGTLCGQSGERHLHQSPILEQWVGLCISKDREDKRLHSHEGEEYFPTEV